MTEAWFPEIQSAALSPHQAIFFSLLVSVMCLLVKKGKPTASELRALAEKMEPEMQREFAGLLRAFEAAAAK
ncbi:MAG: hypothetical protein L0191_10080 [Acidobacteria bacterium]|nr:hypothetical protein [Acidobacteriota bacterium]